MQECVSGIDYHGLPEYEDFRIAIYHDYKAESPRGWSNFGTLVCFGSGEWLGHEGDFRDLTEVEEFCREHDCVDLPVYMLSHGGKNVSVRRFGDVWDCGLIGRIYATPKEVSAKFGADTPESREMARKVLEDEVKDLNMWLTGNVYKFVIEKDGQEIRFGDSSRSGLYGFEKCVDEALGAYVTIIKCWKDPETAMKNFEKNKAFFEDMPDREKTFQLAEAYLRNGGDPEYVPSNMLEKLNLGPEPSCQATMTL